MSVEVLTFGCRLNAAESEVIRARAAEAGLDGAVVVNTCAVTAEAVRQARQAIRKAHRENPDRPVFVTGCAAQIEPGTFAAMPEVARVLGNEEKLQAHAFRPPAFRMEDDEKVKVADIMAVTETAPHLVEGFSERARAFVAVQNGCDHRCTFCVIPFGRGPSRSVPAGAVVGQVRRLVERGYREIVLTGVDLTSWGGDLPGSPALGSLVRTILRHVPELPRLRLSSIDSIEADADLLRALAEEERLMPHLHLSLQAGDDLVLKRMKRRHSRADAVRLTSEFRRLRPDIVFGADLIAGFPTETEAMFDNTLRLVEDCGLTWLHVFPFSPRPGTPAARMPQVGRATAKERAQRLRARGEAARAAYLASQVGRNLDVLIEEPTKARTPGFAPVRIAGAEPGRILRVRIDGTDGETLTGTCLEAAA